MNTEDLKRMRKVTAAITGFEREIIWTPGYDYRASADPEKRQYGCHGMDVTWLLHGREATVQFRFFTGWIPGGAKAHEPMGADLGYHADKPQHGDDSSRPCTYRKGGICYYDGSGVMGGEAFHLLVEKGEEPVWEKMKEFYLYRFKE